MQSEITRKLEQEPTRTLRNDTVDVQSSVQGLNKYQMKRSCQEDWCADRHLKRGRKVLWGAPPSYPVGPPVGPDWVQLGKEGLDVFIFNIVWRIV